MDPIATSGSSLLSFNDGKLVALDGGILLGYPILWLDAENVEIVSGKVTKWYDSSGLNNHCEQSTASLQPSYSNAVPGLNNRPAVYFNSATELLGVNLPNVCNDGDFTIFIVSRGDLVGSYSNYDVMFSVGENVAGRNITMSRYTYIGREHITAFYRNLQVATDYFTYPLSEFSAVNTYSKNINTIAIYQGTTLYKKGSVTGTVVDGPYRISNPIQQGASSRFRGFLAEILVYNYCFSAKQILTTQNYLINKYGLF